MILEGSDHISNSQHDFSWAVKKALDGYTLTYPQARNNHELTIGTQMYEDVVLTLKRSSIVKYDVLGMFGIFKNGNTHPIMINTEDLTNTNWTYFKREVFI